MEIFAPDNAPGTGAGTIESIVAMIGLLGAAAGAGMLLAEGLIGVVLYGVIIVAATYLVGGAEPFAGAEVPILGLLAVLLVIAATRIVLERRAASQAREIIGRAADDPEVKAARKLQARYERRARVCAIGIVALGGAMLGWIWTEWNEQPIRLDDTEAGIGIVVALAAAALGGDAASRFMGGSVRAGGSRLVVAIATMVVSLLLAAMAVLLPFAGTLVVGIAVVLAWRLRRRDAARYKGLRILS